MVNLPNFSIGISTFCYYWYIYTSVLVVLSRAVQNWFNSPSKELLATQGLSSTFYSFDSTRNVLHLFKQHYSLKFKIYCSFVSPSCWRISYHLFWKAMTFHNIDYIYMRKVDFDANDNQISSQLWLFEECSYRYIRRMYNIHSSICRQIDIFRRKALCDRKT